MRKAEVEIYSDQSNAAIMRHPDRRFPGVLVQGDTLYSICQSADEACRAIGRGSPGFDEANEARDALQGLLAVYKAALTEHGMQLPFSEQTQW